MNASERETDTVFASSSTQLTLFRCLLLLRAHSRKTEALYYEQCYAIIKKGWLLRKMRNGAKKEASVA